MASIISDKNTKGKFLVRASSYNGNDIEKLCDTHAEAQEIANGETRWKMRKINGLCPDDRAQGGHCSFREGDGWRITCLYCGANRK